MVGGRWLVVGFCHLSSVICHLSAVGCRLSAVGCEATAPPTGGTVASPLCLAVSVLLGRGRLHLPGVRCGPGLGLRLGRVADGFRAQEGAQDRVRVGGHGCVLAFAWFTD
ncbi:hypothetical protein FNV68_28130 [Streptomyces sp. S1D4-23]|nr:hypothetical protein FNV68_28130 [Streptomyces sp. S1D4-23]